MKVIDFVNGYKAIVIDKLKDSYLKDNLNVKDYIGFADKIKIAERVANSTMFVYKDGVRTNEIRNDSIGRFLLSILVIIDNYTDLEVDFSNVTEEYDLLVKNNILPLLIGHNEEKQGIIPYSEIAEINTLIAMSVDDIMQNNFTTHAFIQNQVTRFGELIGFTFSPLIEKLSDAFEKLDDKTIEKLSKKIDSVINKLSK